MLGWEFPPHITGGLGVACYQIARSLRDHAGVTVMLPNIAPNIRMRDIRLISIGNLNLDKVFTKKELRTLFSKFSKKVKDFSINPYPELTSREVNKRKISRLSKSDKRQVKIRNLLSGTDIYGENVVEKVQFYAEICKKISQDIDFDLIHAHDWMTFPAALAIKELTGKPLVLHIHSLNIDRVGPENQGWIFKLEKEALNRADLILPVSHYTGNLIHEHYGIPKNKIFPVHNGIRPLKTFRSPKKFPEKLVLFLGRVTYQKGPEYFLQVASRILREDSNVRFVLAGKGDKFSRIVEESAYKEIGHKLHFTGFINKGKVLDLLSMTDVMVMPSVSEPFGLAALEAAQFGIPVILSKRSGVAEVLKGAIKADFWDIDHMASSIIRLLADDSFRNKVVKQELKDLKSLTWENTAKNIIKAYSRFNSL
jgi:glycogen(starch) synthase